jgi:hypothetical protein
MSLTALLAESPGGAGGRTVVDRYKVASTSRPAHIRESCTPVDFRAAGPRTDIRLVQTYSLAVVATARNEPVKTALLIDLGDA